MNRLRWYFRWPIKWTIFGIAYVIVCFPYPNLVIRHIRHWSNPNALIEPDCPALQPMARELRAQLPSNLSAAETLSQVESFVYDHVPYDWDWNTWGMADYLPTVEEVVRMGREDCDGRAVVAASLLKNLGFDARIVTDFAHVWVTTPEGETMGPGETKTVEVTEKGMKFNARGLLQIPQILSYGIAVFPLPRELILLGVLWLLLLGRAGPLRMCVSLAFLAGGLLLLRHGAANYRGPQLFMENLGYFAFGLGMALMVAGRGKVQALRTAPESEMTPAKGSSV